MGGEFKLSAQDSDLEYFFEPHQTFWQKATFSKQIENHSHNLYRLFSIFQWNDLSFDIKTFLRLTLHIFVASFWLDKRIRDVFFLGFILFGIYFI